MGVSLGGPAAVSEAMRTQVSERFHLSKDISTWGSLPFSLGDGPAPDSTSAHFPSTDNSDDPRLGPKSEEFFLSKS